MSRDSRGRSTICVKAGCVIQSGPKMAQYFCYAITSSNINRFSKLFHCQNQEKICNNTITKDPITSQIYFQQGVSRPYWTLEVVCQRAHTRHTVGRPNKLGRERIGRLTEFRLGENHPRPKSLGQIHRKQKYGTVSICTVKTSEIEVAEYNGDVRILTKDSLKNQPKKCVESSTSPLRIARLCSNLAREGKWARRGRRIVQLVKQCIRVL